MTQLLGGLSAARFLDEHWQKRPLLVRQAVPKFGGLLAPAELARLACKPEVNARTVTHRPTHKQRWSLDEGPFRKLDVARLPREHFTLLVQGVEQHIDAGWDLLLQFAFVPLARVDDLMVSWAVPGGSVGPHVDAYDVFLLQGPGRRRWQISTQREFLVDEREELPVLRNFKPTDEWVLEPGDMLYLPPQVAHYGVAVEECMTYSIGFLAPTHEQLVHNFLGFLGEEVGAPAGLYSDPDLAVQRNPAELVDATVARVERVLDDLRWDRERVARFLGRFLTGPKPNVRFTKPKRALAADALARGTLALARESRALWRGSQLFVNGDAHDVSALSAPAAKALRELADARRLDLARAELDEGARRLVRDFYARGYVVVR